MSKKEYTIDNETFIAKDVKEFNKIKDEGQYNMIMQGNDVKDILGWTGHKYTTFIFNYDKICEELGVKPNKD